MRLAIACACFVLLAGCRTRATGKVLRRGELECVRMQRSRAPSSPAMWWEARVEGKPFSVSGVSHLGECDVSPNPAVEALVFATQSLVLKDGEPVIYELHNKSGAAERQPGLWACDGHCLFYRHGYVWFERGEFQPIPKLAGHPLSVSPDLKAVVVEGTSTKDTVSFCVADLEAKTGRKWSVARARLPWFTGCENPGRDGSCRAGRGAHFKWARNAAGRDELAFPAESEALQVQATSWDECGPDKGPLP
jgi:hypothetical protein